MKKRKIYISGPITGYDLPGRFAHFEQVEQCLRQMGHEPVNPMKNGLGHEASYDEHMRRDLQMLLECTDMVLLEGWGNSVGCSVEVNVASHTGIRVETWKKFSEPKIFKVDG